jgi:DNA-directed RNA polymerase specialized sigma24 family protein
MSPVGSVTRWISRLKAGDQAALQQLWEGYFRRLTALARRRLAASLRLAGDGEDVALSAFDSFCRRAAAGCFPKLADRHDLWQLLVVLARRKAANRARDERARKRGGGRVRQLSALAGADGEAAAFAGLISREPDPAFAAAVADEYRRLLGLLDSDELRDVAVWKMEGHSNAEIAARLHCAVPRVERKLRRIRLTWEKEGQP